MKSPRRHIKKHLVALDRQLYTWGFRSPDTLALPDFLGIGAQKSGTTWLHRNLLRHPDVFVPPKENKEIHYFDRRWDKIYLNDYTRYFEQGKGWVKGEITPAYAILSPEKIAFIRRIMPDVRLILLLRNPIDRAWSQAVMTLVERAGKAPEEISDDEFMQFLVSPQNRGRGRYSDILGHWLGIFPNEQLFIGFFEDIIERPRKLLEDVFAHLGVSQKVDWESFPYAQQINRGVNAEMPASIRNFLEELYAEEIEVLYQRLGEPVVGWRIDHLSLQARCA